MQLISIVLPYPCVQLKDDFAIYYILRALHVRVFTIQPDNFNIIRLCTGIGIGIMYP